MSTAKKLIMQKLRERNLTNIINKIIGITTKKYSGGSSLRIKAVDLNGSERDILESIGEEFCYGKFDGMYDIYEYKKNFNPEHQTYKYVFVENEWSKDAQDRAIKILKEKWDITDDTSSQERMHCWYDQAKYRILNEIYK